MLLTVYVIFRHWRVYIKRLQPAVYWYSWKLHVQLWGWIYPTSRLSHMFT